MRPLLALLPKTMNGPDYLKVSDSQMASNIQVGARNALACAVEMVSDHSGLMLPA